MALGRAIRIVLALAMAWGCGESPSAEVGFDLADCPPEEGLGQALCGWVQVNEDRLAANGRTIDLRVVVYPAMGRDPQPDPVFVLTGGPGQGAAQLSELLEGMLRDVREDRDLVFVDLRGTGKSNGLPCEIESDDLQTTFETSAFVESLRRCLGEYDADLRHYPTPMAMDDLDEVRERLGYDEINLWGGSYGTRAAQVYVRRHGEHVRSVVFDGAVPMSMNLFHSIPEDAQRALELTLGACERDAACRGAFPAIRAQFQELLDRLSEGPMAVSARHPRTGERVAFDMPALGVTSILRGALYSSFGASMVPLLIDRAHAGDFSGLVGTAFALDPPERLEMSLGMFFSVICAEDLPAADARELQMRASRTFLGATHLEAWRDICAFWPSGSVAEGYFEPVRSDLPTLVLSGALDPVTPPRRGSELARTFSRSRHIVVPGAAHGTSSVGCVPDLVAEFYRRGSPEGLEAECIAEVQPPPFFVTPSGPLMAVPE